MTCTRHPHSSEATAKACYARVMRARADRAPVWSPRYVSVKYDPPLVRGLVTYFFGAKETP